MEVGKQLYDGKVSAWNVNLEPLDTTSLLLKNIRQFWLWLVIVGPMRLFDSYLVIILLPQYVLSCFRDLECLPWLIIIL